MCDQCPDDQPNRDSKTPSLSSVGCTGKTNYPNITPLTEQQLQRLPVGSKVEVIWAGGNGPHIYRILRLTEHGMTRVDDQYKDVLDFIGPDKPYTIVRLIPDGQH